MAGKAGVSQPALAKVEEPGAKPRRKTLAKLAAAMGLSVEQVQE